MQDLKHSFFANVLRCKCWSSKIHTMSLTLNVNRNLRGDFNQQNMKTEEIQKLSRHLCPRLDVFIFLLTAYETRQRTRSESSSVLLPPAVLTSKQTLIQYFTIFQKKFSLLLLICSHIRSFVSYMNIIKSYMCSHLTQSWKWRTCIWCRQSSIYIWWKPEIFHIRGLNFCVSEGASVISVFLSSLKIWTL